MQNWNHTIDGLEGDTTYHVVVRATDVNGGVSFQAGTFHTADEPTHDVRITFHRISVSYDGDASPGNRGELSFAWDVGQQNVGSRAEAKVSDGDVIWIGDANDEWIVNDVAGFLPVVSVGAFERDADGIVEFCALGVGVPDDFGFLDHCDSHWNVAKSGLFGVEDLDGLLRCSQLAVFDGYEDEACLQISTVHQGAEYPSFVAVVSFEVL